MRFYDIRFQDPKSGQPIFLPSLGGTSGSGSPLTSLAADGVSTNRAALNILLDVQQFFGDTPAFSTNTHLTIEGVGIEDINQAFSLGTRANDLNSGAFITISVGMAKGLPLCDPTQQGVILKGQIQQAFGNWIGTQRTLEIIARPGQFDGGGGTGSVTNPLPLVLNWQPAGARLSTVLASTLRQAFPGVKITIQISPQRVLNFGNPAIFQSLKQMSQWLNEATRGVLSNTDPGVRVAMLPDGSILATDGTEPPPPAKSIRFVDIIGQPTWYNGPICQLTLVMRGDLKQGDVINIPPAMTTVTPGASTNQLDQLAFSGPFQIQDVHHFGNYRQATADSWTTVVNVNPLGRLTPQQLAATATLN